MTKLYTIGFVQKSAEEFFTTLEKAGVGKVVDVRLNNVSQLAGFTKKKDFKYFLKAILGVEYVHMPEFVPTKEILDGFKKKKLSWDEYVRQYDELIESRNLQSLIVATDFDRVCLLCSEPTVENCHRRLAAEYIKSLVPGLEVHHL